MSSKIGLILSMVFVSLFLMLGVDLISIQYLYSSLDSISISISYSFSKTKEIKPDYVTYLNDKYHIEITDISNYEPIYGERVEYKINRKYQPLIVSQDEMILSISRVAIVGYYD